MPLTDDLEITLRDFLPHQSDGVMLTDRERGTTTTIVSNRLHARLRAYAEENKLPFNEVLEQLREEIHGGTAADADAEPSPP